MTARPMAWARGPRGEARVRCEGRKPYGPEVIEALRALRRKRKGGRLSFSACAARLQELGIPTKGGRRWQPMTVRAIARREGIA